MISFDYELSTQFKIQVYMRSYISVVNGNDSAKL